MVFVPYYLRCLAHASYLVGDRGIAAVIDPQRDVDAYIESAQQHQLQIRYVIMTHFHADFVAGHLELAKRTGAQIIMHQSATAMYSFRPVEDEEMMRLGGLTLRFLHTPGHTPEGMTIVVTHSEDESKAPMLFTGDTLFIGDVGRPDLLGAKMPKETLAALLYDSLHGKILPLPDETMIYPAHGAGSACGRAISGERWDTLGNQRKRNAALQPMTQEAFIELVTTDLPTPPAYFPKNAVINRQGPVLTESIFSSAEALSLQAFEAMRRSEEVVVLDTRPAATFEEAFIPGSINIGLDGDFAFWVGSVIPFESKVLFVSEPGTEHEVLTRLTRTGYDQIIGWLMGGFATWAKAGHKLDSVRRLRPDELDTIRPQAAILDVRRPSETAAGTLQSAVTIPLNELWDRLTEIPEGPQPVIVNCAGGYRSAIAASILRRMRPDQPVIDLEGGYNAWLARTSS